MGTTKTEMLIGGRYALGEQIGKGGFGVVFRAKDQVLKRDVAVKLLSLPDYANSEESNLIRERFVREATTAARISHPNIVGIYDVGIPTDNVNAAFIVMEYLAGHNLFEQIRNFGPYDPREAMSRFLPLVMGVGKGHQLGVVHKDIKPGNIFVRDAGTAGESLCLLDFGIARVLHEAKMTTTGMLVGTPHYMAPEYISQNDVSPAIDVYQLGLILVELLTGKPAIPHKESFMECCNRHFSGRFDIPIVLTEGEFGSVLKRALATHPSKRFATASEFGEALGKVDPSSIPDEFRTTKALTAVFDADWVNPFDLVTDDGLQTIEDVPALWEPESDEVDPLAFTAVHSMTSDISLSAPTTDELRNNTYSGNTQKAFVATPPETESTAVPTGVHTTSEGRKITILFLVLLLVVIIFAVIAYELA